MAVCTCADPSMVAQAIRQSGAQINSTLTQINGTGQQIHNTMYGQGMGGVPGAPAPVRFCHWAAPEISDIGEDGWSVAFQAAAIAIAIANGLAQAQISEKQQDLAEGWYQQAKYKWDRFNTKYKPLEISMLNEASSTPIRSLDCADDKTRAQAAVNSAYTASRNSLTRLAKGLRICVDPHTLTVIDHKQALMLGDTENYNLNDDQFFTDYKNDQRWNRRSNVLNIGRNNATEALKYGDVARSLLSQVGNQIDRAANTLMTSLGYYGARNDTYYPTTYLGSSG